MIFLPADYIRRYNIPAYDSIGESFAQPFDDSCPFSGDMQTAIANPDRGFRGELYVTLGRTEAYPLSGNDAVAYFHACYEKFRPEGIHLYQLYVYLSEYCKRPLDAPALSQLQEYFLMLSRYHVRVLLRFAYETESSHTCPSTRLMCENIRILKDWMREHRELVCSVVYAAQLGMFGYWGEGHTEMRPCDKKRVIPETIDMFPPHLTVMVRQPKFLRYVPMHQLRRCSVHDDFLVGKEHPWGMIPYSHPQYGMLCNMNRHRLCDGEMPWGRDRTVPDINPLALVRQCVHYGLGTMSAEHGYREDGKVYYLEKWKSAYLTEEEIRGMKMPVFPPMLKDGKISVFDYLQAHLGYLLAISRVDRNEREISFTLYNFGMGVPSDFVLEYQAKGRLVQEDLSVLTAFSCKSFRMDDGTAFRMIHKADPSLFITPMNTVKTDESGKILL